MQLGSLPVSGVLTKAANRDLRRLMRHAAEIEARIDALDAESRKLRDVLLATHQRIEVVRQVALGADVGDAAGMVLSGTRLRQEATRVLAERVGVRTPIHYREWYDLVIGEGFIVVGKRPLSTFLTGASRSSIVKKGEAAGTYLLEPRLLEPLRIQLLELFGELAAVEQQVKSDVRAAEHLRQHAVNLKASIRKLERHIEEGDRAMEYARRATSQIHAA